MNEREERKKPFFRPPLPNPYHSKLSSLLGTGRNFSRVPNRIEGKHHDPPLIHTLFLRSAGGLMSAVVLRPGVEDCYDFIVFNCLTGCVKVLPPPLNPGKLSMAGSVLDGSLDMTLDAQDPSCY
ncbi:hypothetical protein GOP47_0004593 [Adiantum capillus-veneris]|uniref:Uncharacterized protein n=1 Tax=Adiantum capillus-veneris TaxID=13818 RepID=A0A9D4V8I8_ADICA|nr:hypothetical protein GOP47_0004593 [Adiantum capillus-veneris]